MLYLTPAAPSGEAGRAGSHVPTRLTLVSMPRLSLTKAAFTEGPPLNRPPTSSHTQQRACTHVLPFSDCICAYCTLFSSSWPLPTYTHVHSHTCTRASARLPSLACTQTHTCAHQPPTHAHAHAHTHKKRKKIKPRSWLKVQGLAGKWQVTCNMFGFQIGDCNTFRMF